MIETGSRFVADYENDIRLNIRHKFRLAVGGFEPVSACFMKITVKMTDFP